MRIFKSLPASLEGLSVDELNALMAEHREIAAKLAKNDPEIAPPDQFGATDILDELKEGGEQYIRLEAEIASRSEAETVFVTQAAEAAAVFGVDASAEDEPAGDDDADADSDADAGDADADAPDADADSAAEDAAAGDLAAETPVVADAGPAPRRPLARQVPAAEPVIVEEDGPTHTALVASAGIKGFAPGQELDRLGFATAAIEAASRVHAKHGERVEVVVASAHWDAPPERVLKSDDADGNAAKIKAVVGADAQVEFVAAGNVLCAPLTPIYDLPQISTADEPLWQSLPTFQADRGGITWGTPPSIADVTTAVGIITQADEEEGGTFATKSCQLLECDAFNSQEVASIFHCLQWGNLGARAWPERVAQFTEVVMAAWAKLAEENILNLVAAGSTQVTAAQATYGYGALSNLTSQILVAAAGYRSRFRMDLDARFVFWAPHWVRDLLLSDLINAQFDRFAIDGYAGVDSFLRSKGIEPVWYLDEESGGGQIFAAQGAGALLEFPVDVKWFLFPIGTWIGLDTGTLELGIVRDSVLNLENEFQVFGEAWRSVAQVGFQSLEITSELCPSGATGGPNTILTCS